MTCQRLAPFGGFRFQKRTGHFVQVEEIFHFLRREPPVEFHGDCTKAFDGHFGNYKFWTVSGDDSDAGALLHTEAAQIVRRLVHQRAKLCIGDAPIAEDNCLAFRAAGEGFVQDLTNAGVLLESTQIFHA